MPEPSHPLQATAVRIWGSADRVAGAGFLAAERHVLTCAHVVARALGVREDASELPSGEVHLDFPLVAPGETIAARVIGWLPVRSGSAPALSGGEDVAVLELTAAPPFGARAARLVCAEDAWGHAFRAFGFPAGYDDGVWASGTLRDRLASGWVQVEDAKQTGYFVEPGFSGGPIWDEEERAVVGMVVGADRRADVRVAFAIPVPLLLRAWPPLDRLARSPSPYRGLLAFCEDDAPFFFGRERFTDLLMAAVSSRSKVAVIGPSGSGKSSVAFAGLVPRLRAVGGWLIVSFRPGARPFDALGAALVPQLETGMSETDRLVEIPKLAGALRQGSVGLRSVLDRIVQKTPATSRVLLIADQFEELFTLCRDAEERRVFLDVLLAAFAASTPSGSPEVVAVLTMRADFLGHALSSRPLADALQDADVKLGPMTEEELRAAIERPAEKLGVRLEPGLTDRILEDVGEEPGHLPLLEFALTRLWEEQQDRCLTHAAYDAIGGVERALAGHADEVCGALSGEEQRVRRVFTQLVRPGEGTTDTRRRATRAELGEGTWELVARLATEKLVVTGRDEGTGEETVEVAHEALIGGWGRLREWMGEDREFRTWQERLRAAQRQWEATGRDEGALLRGGPLAEAEEWLARRGDELGGSERGYIAASMALRDRELARRRRFRLAIVAASLAAALVASVLAGWAWVERDRAEGERVRAEQAARTARSLQLMAEANSVVDDQLDLALLLSLEAVRVDDSVGTRKNVVETVLRNPYLTRFLQRHSDNVTDVAYSHDGATLASASKDGTVRLWDPKSGQPKGEPLVGSIGTIHAVAFGVDDRTVAAAGDDGSVALWDAVTHQPLPTLTAHAGRVSAVGFSPNGALLATAGCGRLLDDKLCDHGEVRLWDLAVGGQSRLLASDLVQVNAVAFSPDGATVTAGGCSRRDDEGTCNLGVVHRWNVDTGERIEGSLQGHVDGVLSLAFGSDGATLASAACARRDVAGMCELGEIRLWDPKTGQPKGEPLAGHTGTIHDVALGPDGILASAGGDGRVILWDTRTLEQRATLEGHGDQVTGVAFSPDGESLASSSQDRALILWDTRDPPRRTLEGHTAGVGAVAFADTSTMISGGEDGAVNVWDLGTDRPRTTLSDIPVVKAVGSSPDGTRLAAGGCAQQRTQDICDAGGLRLWNLAAGRPIGELLEGHAFGVTGLDFDAAGAVLASGGCGERDAQGKCSLGELRLWDPATAKPLGDRLPGDLVAVNAVAFSPDGATLAAGGCGRRNTAGTCESGVVHRWDVDTGRPIGEPLAGQQANTVRSIAFSPKDQILASGGVDGKVVLWDTSTGEPLSPHLDHGSNAVRSVAFSPDGEILAAGTDDGTVVLWDVDSGQRLGQLTNDPSLGRSVAFSPDGRILAAGSRDGRIVLWDGEFDAWQAHACERANRNLAPSEWERYLGSKPEPPTCPNLAPGDEPARRPPATPAVASVTAAGVPGRG